MFDSVLFNSGLFCIYVIFGSIQFDCDSDVILFYLNVYISLAKLIWG